MTESRKMVCKKIALNFGRGFSTKGRKDCGKMTLREMPLNIGAISSTL